MNIAQRYSVKIGTASHLRAVMMELLAIEAPPDYYLYDSHVIFEQYTGISIVVLKSSSINAKASIFFAIFESEADAVAFKLRFSDCIFSQ